MTIRLEFKTFFSAYLGFEDTELEVREGSVLGDAIALYLKQNPDKEQKARESKLFLEDKLRAIYMIDDKAVKENEALKDGDTVKVLKAFIGG